jgi:hypothetical protein
MTTPRLAPIFCAIATLATLAGSVAAQGNAADLGKRNARSKYTLGRLFAVQELPDGRVVASDTKEQVFRIVDLVKGDVGLVGKQGDDADNYRAASLILRLPGDSLGLYDPAGRKLLHVTPQGTVASFVPLPNVTLTNNRRLGTLLGADLTGALYFNLGEQFDTATKALSGVAGITRVAPGTTTDEPQLTYRTRRADQTKPSGIMPYVFRDAVVIRTDGLVARVIADTYQVIWIRNGKETGRTGPLPFQPIPISAAEQQAFKDSTIEQLKAGMAAGRAAAANGAAGGATKIGDIGGGGGGTQMIVINGGGGGNGGAMPAMVAGGGAGQRLIVNGVDVTSSTAGGDTKIMSAGSFNPADMPFGTFPDRKPAILTAGVVAMFDNNGMLWVARERVRGDAVPHYDVIAEGKGVVARVNFPTGTRLVGFGKNAVYLARDEDGSDWLERYAMPKM